MRRPGPVKQARKHHYLPQFYLAGFTNDGTREGSLRVLDQLTLKDWPSTPLNAGAEIDLYAVTVATDETSDYVERGLATFEGAVAPAVQQTVNTGVLPTGDGLDRLLDFVGSMATRTPAAFENFVTLTNHLLKEAAQEHFSDDKAYLVELTRLQGGRAPTDEELARFKKFIEHGEFHLRPTDNNDAIQFMAHSMVQTVVSLAERSWSLISAQGSAEFVCSDHPVALCFNGANPHPKGFRLGFRTPGTWLIMPLSKRHMLIGSIEGRHLRGPVPIEGVGWLNRKIIEGSRRFLFCSTGEICWLDQGRLASKRDLIEARRWATSST